jgi:hypothetical protein
MSYVVAAPEALASAAANAQRIGLALSEANSAAATMTTDVPAAGADEVSAAIASPFSGHGLNFQAISNQAAAFHTHLVDTLAANDRSYTAADATPVAGLVWDMANPSVGVLSPWRTLLGRPLICNGVDGAAGTGAAGTDPVVVR